MKFSRLHKILFVAVGIIAGVFIACNEWDYIDQPETVYLNEDVKVPARIRIEPSTNYDSRLIFGMYAPKSLDLKNNAKLIFNTLNINEVHLIECIIDNITKCHRIGVLIPSFCLIDR